jgi:hypothetical protein
VIFQLCGAVSEPDGGALGCEYVHRRPVTIPSDQLDSPVISSFGNAAILIAKKDDMKDRGRKMMVTTVNTKTVYTVRKLDSCHFV